MSDLSSTSYCKDNRNDNGISPIFLILLLTMCGGDGGLLGGCGGSNDCGGTSGLSGILPLILILSLSGNSLF
jgi:hypothetical protein